MFNTYSSVTGVYEHPLNDYKGYCVSRVLHDFYELDHHKVGFYGGGGLDARYERHARTNALVHDWAKTSGFDFFAEEGFRSKTLTCVKNNRGIDVLKLARDLRAKHHLVIDPGYGKIQGKTFRLSNMGDETEETVSHLLACLDDCLG